MYTLYWCPNTAALLPEMLLAESDLPFEKVLVEIRKGQNLEPAYLAVNPAGFVPALKLPDGQVIAETAAILLYLCERHDLDLAPALDDRQRPVFLHMVLYLSNALQATYKRYYYPQRFSTEAAAAPGIKARTVELLDEQWALLEARLQTSVGPFLLGEACSAADLYLAMLVTWYPDRPALLTRLPALARCFGAVLERPVARRILTEHGALEG